MKSNEITFPSGLGFSQHQGRRDYQEDFYGFNVIGKGVSKTVVIALADGMGGHVGGATASNIAVQASLNMSAEQGEAKNKLDSKYLSEQVYEANKFLAKTIEKKPELSGMGTTLVLLTINKDGYNFASVGDSPLWVYRNDEFIRLNADHSMAPVLDDMVEVGRLTAEEARKDPKRNALRSALAGDDIELIDVSEKLIPSKAGDIIILASDGLQTLTDAEIAELISDEKTANELAQVLVEAVLAKGTRNQDNITVTVIKVSDFFSAEKIAEPTGAPRNESETVEDDPVMQPLQRPRNAKAKSVEGEKSSFGLFLIALIFLALLGYTIFRLKTGGAK